MKTNIAGMIKKDMKLLVRENTILLLLVIFIGMTLLSTALGWSARHTIQEVYNYAARELGSAGKAVPTFPLATSGPLSLIKNMIIYLALTGALLAICIGHLVATNDRRAGTSRILFSKPLSRADFFAAKICGTSLLLFMLLCAAMLVSIVSLFFIQGLNIGQIASIFFFYSISFLYLCGFSYLAIFWGLRSVNSTSAILFPLFLWLIITFALPEFGSALYPSASLNSVLPSSNLLESPALKIMHECVYPFSISEHFKALSSHILCGTSGGTPPSNIKLYSSQGNFSILSVWFILTLLLAYFSARTFKPALGDNYE